MANSNRRSWPWETLTGYAVPAPTLTSITPNHGNATAMVPFVLVGTGFAVGAVVVATDADGTPHLIAGTVRVSSVQITGTLPTLPAGVKSVNVVNPDGQVSNAVVYTAFRNALKGSASIVIGQTGSLIQRRALSGSASIVIGQTGDLQNNVPPFQLADLNPDFYFRGSYGGIPFLPTAPGDTHGNLTKLNSLAPDVGAAVNGFTPARLSGSKAFKAATAHTPDIITASAFTIVILQRQFSLNSDDANFRNEPLIAGDDNLQWGTACSQSGYRAGIFDPGFGPRQTAYVPIGSFGQTTIAAGSDGAVLPQATINVASTAGAYPSGSFSVNLGGVHTEISYTGVSGNSFTGCTGGSGTLHTGQPVTAEVWVMTVQRFDLVNVKLRVSKPDGTTNVSAPCTVAPFITGGTPNMGESVNSGENMLGEIMEWAAFKRVVSDSDVDKIPGYFNNRYLIPPLT